MSQGAYIYKRPALSIHVARFKKLILVLKYSQIDTAANESSGQDELQPGCSADFVKPEAEMDLDMPNIECHVSRN